MNATTSPLWRRDSAWFTAGLLGACLIAALCVGFLVRQEWPWLRFPADVLTWSESGFVGNVIKLERGVPLYGAPADSNSVIYTPGAPALTWVLLSLAGIEPTVPALRSVQATFVVAAVLLAGAATLSTRRILLLERLRHGRLWATLSLLLLLLAATSPQVNRLVLTLHSDALALLVSIASWIALLSYARAPSLPRLLVLAALPAVGFAVKQFLLVWCPVTLVVLALLPRPAGDRSRFGACFLYLLLAAGANLAVLALFFALWGNNFWFWAFEVMGGRPISLAGEWSIALLRSADHLLRAWWELALGAVACWWLLWRTRDRRWLALVCGWLALVGFEALTSGAGWGVLYHFGPAALIGTSALVAALPTWAEEQLELGRANTWGSRARFLAPLLLAGITLSICQALRVVPTRDPAADRWFPGRVPSPELIEQARLIEREFQGLSPNEVLLDIGNWVYLSSRFVALDRADALADQPPGGHHENFAPFLERIRSQHYRKILVRGLHDPRFLYDWPSWSRPSGVRAALTEFYREVAVLPATAARTGVLAGAVSVLVPRERE